MNDQQFLERAHANPHDDSPEFLEAAAASPENQQLLDELRQFDAGLKAGLQSVSAPAGLKQALLDIPEGKLHPDTASSAANDSLWRRNIQYAAGLVIALGVIALLLQSPANPMADMVFSHIYSEMDFLEDDTPVTLAAVNAIMNTRVGGQFESSAEMESLHINHMQDCWVDLENGIRGVHFVMEGNMGPVTVLMIPNSPVAEEMSISDDRFDGVISPTPGGNMVIIGEKQESIQEYSTLLAGNINW